MRTTGFTCSEGKRGSVLSSVYFRFNMNDHDVIFLPDEFRFNPRHCMFETRHPALIDKANSVTFPPSYENSILTSFVSFEGLQKLRVLNHDVQQDLIPK